MLFGILPSRAAVKNSPARNSNSGLDAAYFEVRNPTLSRGKERGAVIGGNAFVTKSVPEQTRVSAKMPELQFKRHENVEFQSGEFLNYEI